jgi:two-component system sensor histidine kinase RegB
MPSPDFIAGGAEAPAIMLRLVLLRWWLLALELAAILAVPPLLGIALPRAPMLVVVALQALGNGITARRVGSATGVGDTALLLQFVTDIAALAVLMFLSGGAANPLISLLLPPVAIAALVLPGRAVTIVALLAIGAYSLLNLLYLPLPIADAERAARLHLAGMWITFVLSVSLVAWFVVRMTAALRRRDAELAAAREKALRDERVVALGALAAGAAHELSTPLATMAVVASELARDAALDDTLRPDVALLRQQVAACKAIISGLAERAGAARPDSVAVAVARDWLAATFERWRQLRPQAEAELDLAGVPPRLTIVAEPTLAQGLLNLFNNAADAGPPVRVAARREGEWLIVEVRDGGPGFAPQVLVQAGRAPFPAHAGGSGVGLFLAQAAAARLGGELTLHNEPEKSGGVARLRLPAGMEA